MGKGKGGGHRKEIHGEKEGQGKSCREGVGV